MPEVHGIQCVLLDIEGTICPISFVKATLFPYALAALPKVLQDQWTSSTLAPYLAAFPAEHRATPEALQAHVEDLTARDVKVPALKNLQGYLWEEGYVSGAYATPLFDDVVPALRAWRAQGAAVAVYSSGSVKAQKLLFAFVKAGNGAQTEDLTGLVSGWYDTTNAGPKVERGSYELISRELKYDGKRVLFLSDNVKEVDAAIAAGMQSILVDRPGNASVSEDDRSRLTVVTTFDDIAIVSV